MIIELEIIGNFFLYGRVLEKYTTLHMTFSPYDFRYMDGLFFAFLNTSTSAVSNWMLKGQI